MYGNDLSSRSRTLNGGRWRLTRFCSRWSASASLWVTITSIRPIALDQLLDALARVAAAVEVAAHAGPQRLRLADVEDLVALVAKEVDARARWAADPAAPERNLPRTRASVSAALLRPRSPCGSLVAALALALAGAGRRARRWRSAPPRTSSARPISSRAQAKMTLLRLAGFTAVRVTSHWLPGTSRRRRATSSTVLRNVDGGGPARRRPGLRLRLPPRLAHDAARRPRRSAQFARYTAALAAAIPTLRRRHRRQRAEPQPLLAAAVQPRRRRTPPRPPTSRSSPRPTTRSRRSTRARASGAARSRRAASTARTAPPTRTRRPRSSRRPGRRLPGERPHAAGHGRARVPSRTRTTRAQSPDIAHPQTRRRSALPTTTSSSRCSATAFDGTAQPGSTLPILYDEFGIESIDPGGQAQPLHRRPSRRRRSPSTRSSRRAYYARGAPARVLPAERRRDPRSSTRTTSTALASWQSGVYYADGTPKASLSAVRDALDRARGGSIARCEGLGARRRARRTSASPAAGRVRHAARATCASAARSTAPGSSRVTRPRRPAPRAASVAGYGRAVRADRRVAQGAQARHRPGALHAHGHPPGEPGRPADPRERRRCSLR